MYAPIDTNNPFQGDILASFPFIALPQGEEPKIVRTDPTGNLIIRDLSETHNPYQNGKELLVVNSFVTKAIIISQTCDAQRRDYVHVCPVFPISSINAQATESNWDTNRLANYIADIRNNKKNYFFHLPEAILNDERMEESYIDLQVVNILPRLNLGQYVRVVTLTDLGRHRLAYKLLNFYGRPI